MENAYEKYKAKADTILNTYSAKTAVSYLTDSGDNIRFSFSDIQKNIQRVKAALEQSGVVCGDRVAVLTPHSPYGVIAGLSLAYFNMTSVLIDATLPAEEICRLLAFSDVRALFTTTELFEKLPLDLTKDIPCFALGAGNTIHSRFPSSASKVCRGETVDRERDVISIIFSSGTTDQMKGVKITYHSVLCARDIFAALSGLRDDMTYLLVLPFNHIAGFTGAMTYFLTGCELDFLEHVDPLKLQRGLQYFQPHYFAMIPKVYEIIEEKIRAELHAKGKVTECAADTLMRFSGFLRKYFGINAGKLLCHSIVSKIFGENIYGIGTGASPCRDSATEFFLNLGLQWANLYATTETGVPIVSTGIHDRYPVGTVGNVNRHKEIKVKIDQPDKDGIGEIVVKTEMIMKGYFRRPDLTEAAFSDGYFKTGDYGYVDKKGNLHITGRIKEAILLKNGKKVSPTDIDAYYDKACGGVSIACCGVTGADGVDTVHLFLETQGRSRAELDEARRRIQEQSSAAGSVYQITAVHEIDRIPLTSVGKVKRFLLKKAVDEEDKSSSSEKVLNDSGENVFGVIQNLIRSITKTEREISPDIRLQEDLGLDSLEIFELCVALEEKYHVSIGPSLYKEITIGELEKLIGQGEQTRSQANVNTHGEIAPFDVNTFPMQRYGHDLALLRKIMTFSKTAWRFEITGVENIPESRNYILCPNHESHLDGLWVFAAIGESRLDFEKICCMAKKEHLEHFFSRKWLQLLGGIPVDRYGNPLNSIKRCIRCVCEGDVLLIHPEGTRTRDGRLGPFKEGAAKIALETDVSIVPVCINGAYEIFPPHRKLPHLFDWRHLRRYPLQICFGTPISPEGKTAKELTAEIEQQIVAMKQEWKP